MMIKKDRHFLKERCLLFFFFPSISYKCKINFNKQMELKECKEIIKKFNEYKLSYEDEHSVVYTGKGEENKIELTLVRENVDYIFIQSPFVSTDEPESNLEVNVYIAGGKRFNLYFLEKMFMD